jgi:hypothetical protein
VVLSQKPPYVLACEVEKNTVFKTNVRPAWWLSGTDMTIQLTASPDGTTVTAGTKSQAYIMGDVFGFYGRYIQSFLSDVRRVLRGGITSSGSTDEQVLRDAPTAA